MLAIGRLDLQAGERLAVLGPNGAGKTTLLRLMAGLDRPSIGSVEVDGEPIAGADLDLRRRIGYATQRPGLLSTSVIRNVELPLRWRGLDGPARMRAAHAALERLGVAELANRKAPTLSGGEAQRVSLARALAVDPGLLLLDEPAAGLDTEARRAFFDDLELALSDRATTVVHVSHRAEEALRMADRSRFSPAGRSGRSASRPRSCNTRGTRTWRDWSATKTSCRCTSTTRDRSWSTEPGAEPPRPLAQERRRSRLGEEPST